MATNDDDDDDDDNVDDDDDDVFFDFDFDREYSGVAVPLKAACAAQITLRSKIIHKAQYVID